MTKSEFTETKFSNQTELIYKGKKYKLHSVDFGEGIITLLDDPDADGDIIVRYENCELASSVQKTFRTFDDVEVKMDATVYGVHPKTFDKQSVYAENLVANPVYHWFSTSESRSNWIAQNEKVYSRRELKDAVNGVLERLGAKC